MNRYLFLVAWIEGCDTADELDIHNGVFSQDDLLPRFEAGEQEILSVLVSAPNETIAYAMGCKEAFDANFTGYDSFSTCIRLGKDYVLTQKTAETVTVDLTPEV